MRLGDRALPADRVRTRPRDHGDVSHNQLPCIAGSPRGRRTAVGADSAADKLRCHPPTLGKIGMTTTGRLPRLPRFGGWHLGSAGGTAGSIGTVVQSVATQYDGDSIPVFVTTSQLNADGTTYRTSYVRNWYNNANQLTNTANYGTNNGTSMSQQPAAPPGPVGLAPISNTSVLATSYQYDAGGFLSSTTDPTGLQTTYANDSIELSGSRGRWDCRWHCHRRPWSGGSAAARLLPPRRARPRTRAPAFPVPEPLQPPRRAKPRTSRRSPRTRQTPRDRR